MEESLMNKKITEKYRNRHTLDGKEAAQYLGLHRSTLDKWRMDRAILPFHRVGRKVLYLRSDLDTYLASCRVEPVEAA
jgi:excisionase family DNA binding protein